MKIYIPNHLKNLEIINQLDKLIKGYSDYYSEPITSFDDYQYSLVNDPVKKFLSICIPKNNLEDSVYIEIINYLSKLFYSVKGTVKVFEYMKYYLNLNIKGDIIYTTKYLEINLSEITLTDENLFYESMKNFLDSLLYFQELRTNIGTINLILEGEIDNYISTNIKCYNNFTAEPYYESSSE